MVSTTSNNKFKEKIKKFKTSKFNFETKSFSDVPESQSSANGSSGDDIFSSFLSAPPSSSASSVNGGSTNTSSSSATNPAGKTEEENFFNQPMPSTQEKNKMTKDSIMALYGTSSQKPSFPATSGWLNLEFDC